jgi:hypothetical protein
MGNKNVTRDIWKDSITCGDNTENMGNVFVTHDIRGHSYGLGSSNQTHGLQKRNPQ